MTRMRRDRSLGRTQPEEVMATSSTRNGGYIDTGRVHTY